MEDFRYKRGEILDVHPNAVHYKKRTGVTYEVIESKPVKTAGLPRREADRMKYVRWLKVRPSTHRRLSGWILSTEFVRALVDDKTAQKAVLKELDDLIKFEKSQAGE